VVTPAAMGIMIKRNVIKVYPAISQSVATCVYQISGQETGVYISLYENISRSQFNADRAHAAKLGLKPHTVTTFSPNVAYTTQRPHPPFGVSSTIIVLKGKQLLAINATVATLPQLQLVAKTVLARL